MKIELLPYKDRLVQLASACTALMDVGVIVVDKWLNQLINTFHYERQPIDIQVNSVVGSVIVTGKPVIVKDRRQSSECQSCADFHSCSIDSIIGVPILTEAECIGAIAMLIPPSQPELLGNKSEEIVPLMEQIAFWIAKAIESDARGTYLNDLRERAVRAFGAVPDPVAVTDEKMRIVFCNEAFCGFFGIDDAVGGDLDRLLLRQQAGQTKDILREDSLFFGEACGLIRLTAIKDMKLDTQDGAKLYVYAFERVGCREALKLVAGDPADEEMERFWGPGEDMQEAKRRAKTAVKNNLPVLIEGHDQAQAERLIRMLHKSSSAGDAPFFKVDCRREMQELEKLLFGVGGEVPGMLRLSKNSVLCLWMINHMPMYIQKRLAAYISEQQLSGMQGSMARIIAASDESLENLVRRSRFSQQLLRQISQNYILIPDIGDNTANVNYYLSCFVEKFAEAYHCSPNELGNPAWAELYRKNFSVDYLSLQRLAEVWVMQHRGRPARSGKSGRCLACAVDVSLGAEEQEAQLQELRGLLESGGSKQEIAKALGISRATLYRWIDKYSLNERKQERKRV